jgi:hypothetical protein
MRTPWSEKAPTVADHDWSNLLSDELLLLVVAGAVW